MNNLLLPNKQAVSWLLPVIKGVWNPSEKKPASGTTVRQWIEQGVIQINNEPVTANEFIDFPVFSIVVFPNSKRRITIW
jgi:hypothetical protein